MMMTIVTVKMKTSWIRANYTGKGTPFLPFSQSWFSPPLSLFLSLSHIFPFSLHLSFSYFVMMIMKTTIRMLDIITISEKNINDNDNNV